MSSFFAQGRKMADNMGTGDEWRCAWLFPYQLKSDIENDLHLKNSYILHHVLSRVTGHYIA
jgi:hypothetical protein